jgi:prepilin signal peptidase PulO-like enzyme (type II secretory pathway)
MSTPVSQNDASYGLEQPQRRLTTETKAAVKTTEFFAFVAMVLAVVATANFYDGDGTNGDPFGATTAMRFVVYLTIGYMIARGIAKSGSRERYDA